MNVFITDHPMVSQPKEHLPHARWITRKVLGWALIFSVLAEGISGTGCFYLSQGNPLLYLCGIFHLPGLLVAAVIFPDVMDDYGTQEQECIFTCIVIALTWFQWFVIFLLAMRLKRKNKHAHSQPPLASGQ